MIRSYLKIAWRNLARAKSYAFINVAGLAVGLTGATLILLWINHELSFDRFHKNADQLFEVYLQNEFDGEIHTGKSSPEPMAPALKAEYPEVAGASRYSQGSILMHSGDKTLNQSVAFIDPDFFRMFSFPFVEGNAASAFARPNSVLLTESTSKKLFGNEKAVGKTLEFDDEGKYPVTVSGVLQDLPANTRFTLDAVMSWQMYDQMKFTDTSPHAWTNGMTTTFVQLKAGTNLERFNARIRDLCHRKDAAAHSTILLYPSAKWHLYERFENGKVSGGRIERVQMFAVIALFILLIACINFMNLSTARSEKRAKEVGVRKVAGARRGMLIGQFISESLLLAFLAGGIALLLVVVTLPGYESLIGEKLQVPYRSTQLWLGGLLLIGLCGLLAGSYPAFFLSSFSPATVLKGTHISVRSGFRPRKVLVVLQFTFSIALIMGTLVVRQQIRYAENRDTGYDRDQLLTVYLNESSRTKGELIRNDILNAGAATSITKTGSPMTRAGNSSSGIGWEGKDPNAVVTLYRYAADMDWTKTTVVQLLAGRDIDVRKFPTDSTAILLNESAVKAMGLKDPIGKTIEDNLLTWTIVGVVKDFLINSPYSPVEPMIIEGPKGFMTVMSMRLNGSRKTADNLATIEKILRKYGPEYPFEYEFADESYAAKFKSEQRTAALTGLFSGLSIFISCLGLFGLAAYTAEQRSKEIGIRKVLGATVASIVRLLSGDFLLLVAIAFLIASPIAYYAMNKWLQGYEYRVSFGWEVLAVTCLGTGIIALLTVSFQAIKAALANPVDSLRDE